MKYSSLIYISTLFLAAILNGCVSVNLSSKKVQKSKEFSFVDPTSPYEAVESAKADHIWVSKKTKNTITIFSECNSNQEVSLKYLALDTYKVFDSYETPDEKLIDYNEREALQSTVRGKMDGVSIKMDIVFLKKNECQYILSYFGNVKNFDQEQTIFNQFLEKFKVP